MTLKVWATALALCVAFAAGYRYSAALYDADITALREDYANRSKALEDNYRAKERESMEKLSQAWALRDSALGHVDDLADELERVRQQAADAKRRLSAAGAGSCDAERKQLARCADLLGRGAGLVRRGVDLSERTAIDKDAMAMIVSQ
jgi:hypothetical protein